MKKNNGYSFMMIECGEGIGESARDAIITTCLRHRVLKPKEQNDKHHSNERLITDHGTAKRKDPIPSTAKI